MFNADFYPTPKNVIFEMLQNFNATDKIILEPSAGKGDILDALQELGSRELLFCEINEDLQKISQTKARFLCSDFLKLTSDKISHIDAIIMNPPFTADEKHILHAFNIAPPNCKIIALCNSQTIENAYSQSRKELKQNINLYGTYKNLGECFTDSERRTGVQIGLIEMLKPGNDYNTEFEGFFLDEEEEPQANGLLTYNVVRDLVNRYVESIKIFDRQLEEAEKMNQLTKGYFSCSNIALSFTNDQKPLKRSEFKKEMQKSGWNFIFNKMNIKKHATRQLLDDINKFVEEQQQIPFTMKNIYRMLEIIIGTTSQRMDKAIEVVFDKVTRHHHENRYGVKGWKTNENYVLTKKFIIPGICYQDQRFYKGSNALQLDWSNTEILEDMLKGICYLTGDNYENFPEFRHMNHKYNIFVNGKFFNKYHDTNKACDALNNFKNRGENAEMIENPAEYGVWFDWAYFRVKCHKSGTAHLEFKDVELWARYNQKIAEIKGFPLYEKAPDKRTERQKQKAEQAKSQSTQPKQKPTILGTFKIKTAV